MLQLFSLETFSCLQSFSLEYLLFWECHFGQDLYITDAELLLNLLMEIGQQSLTIPKCVEDFIHVILLVGPYLKLMTKDTISLLIFIEILK